MANINRPVIPEGNDTALCIQIKYYKAGEYLDFDLTQVSDLKVILTCSKHNTIIPLEFTIDEADHSILHCPIDYRLLHANTSYGVSVSGYDAESIHFKWTMLPREGFLVVPNTSGTHVTDEVQIIDLQGRVGWGGIDMSEYIPKSEKGQSNGVATLDSYGNVPESQLNLRLLAYIKKSEKGQANGVASLGSDGKVPAYQLQDYILSSQKGQANGVATLNDRGVIPESQLQFPTRGQLNPANINNLDFGVYWVNGKVISQDILNGEQANGILVAYPYGSKVQMLYVGRAAGAASGEQVEVYSRRYLATPQRWTEWNRIDDKDQYSLIKSGSNIQLTKNGTVIASVVDSNTTYTNMTQNEANTGTATTARSISAKVLNTTIQNKINAEKLVIEGTLLDDFNVEFPEGSFERVYEALEQGKYVQLKLNGTYFQLNCYDDAAAFFSTLSAEESYLESLYIYSDDTGESFFTEINNYDYNFNVTLDRGIVNIQRGTYQSISTAIKNGYLSKINLYVNELDKQRIEIYKISRKFVDGEYITFEHTEIDLITQIQISPNDEGFYNERQNIVYSIATEAQIATGTDNTAKVVSPRVLRSSWRTLYYKEQEFLYDWCVIPARLVGNQVEFDDELREIFDSIHQFIFTYPELQDRCKIILDEQYIYNLSQKTNDYFYFEYTNAEETYIASISLYVSGDNIACEYFLTPIPSEPYYRKITSAELTWNNGWTQGGTGDMSRVEFTKYGKVVYVNGTILNETDGASLSSILTIPANLSMFRPKRTVQWAQISQQLFATDSGNRVPSYFIQLDKNGLLKIEKLNIGGVGTQYQANKNLFISGSYIVD